MIELIAFDADDTLWHNEVLFQETQARFAALLAPFAGADAVHECLDAVEAANNRIFGYGIKGFTLSMVETAVDISEGHIAAADIHSIVAMGKSMLEAPVDLLDGAVEVLEAVGRRLPLALITKGDHVDQARKIGKSGLAGHFRWVEIVVRKDLSTYRDLFDAYGVDPATVAMVGNSVPSDIRPVLELGGWAVHIPYSVTASFERHRTEPEHERYFKLDSIRQLPGLLDRLGAGREAANQAKRQQSRGGT